MGAQCADGVQDPGKGSLPACHHSSRPAGASGVDLLRKVHADYPATPVIVMTASAAVQSAVEAMKAGVAVRLFVQTDSPTTAGAGEPRVRITTARREHPRYAQSPEENGGFEQMVGSSSSLLEALDVARRVAATDATI